MNIIGYHSFNGVFALGSNENSEIRKGRIESHIILCKITVRWYPSSNLSNHRTKISKTATDLFRDELNLCIIFVSIESMVHKPRKPPFVS